MGDKHISVYTNACQFSFEDGDIFGFEDMTEVDGFHKCNKIKCHNLVKKDVDD